MKERTRFQHEVELLTQPEDESYRQPYLREVESSKISPIHARILWPALGFPSVISPGEKKSTSSFQEGDATKCICVLVLCDKSSLSEEDAARHLRFVPWEKRSIRHIPFGPDQNGTFRKEDLKIFPLRQQGPNDRYGEQISFGANIKGENGIVANLARRVTQVYRDLKFRFEIRVNELASRKLSDGLYHLFWNNETTSEIVPSDEMTRLLRDFARPKREKLGLWKMYSTYLLNEYRYEYGSLHLPYSAQKPGQLIAAEILHPLCVRSSRKVLRIGHLTDTHVAVRHDIYRENLKNDAVAQKNYINWNENFVKVYNLAKKHSDLLLLTGDLIDYGRDHWGMGNNIINTIMEAGTPSTSLVQNGFYHSDRNWFLFYYLLASGIEYSVPVYTILGNHDWRLNPYPPFSLGAPDPHSMFRNKSFILHAMDEALRKAHGDDKRFNINDPKQVREKTNLISYNTNVEKRFHNFVDRFKHEEKWETVRQLYRLREKDWKIFKDVFGGGQTLDVPGFPTETNIESVEWYLLSINPFLDYFFTQSSGHSILMLDWAEDENVVFPGYHLGKRYTSLRIGRVPIVREISWDEGPNAKNSLTPLQQKLIEKFLKLPNAAKVIGIHAPPIGPFPGWYDHELRGGWKDSELENTRGYPEYRIKYEGRYIKGHPLFAIKPAKGLIPDAIYGMHANYGSFEEKREWFIKTVADQKYHVRVVLSGHNHRKGLFIVYKASQDNIEEVAGEMLIRSVEQQETFGVPAPNAAKWSNGSWGRAPGPLYINGTSIGPLGHRYFKPEGQPPAKDIDTDVWPGYYEIDLEDNGTIKRVLFIIHPV